MKLTKKQPLLTLFLLIIAGTSSYAQYNDCKAQNSITESYVVKEKDAKGNVVTRVETRKAAPDKFGNAEGNRHDLAIDGAFDGQTIVVLHLYTGEGFDFDLPKKALQEKGFSVYRYINQVPDPKTLKEALSKACQLWVISTSTQFLSSDHVGVIKDFFDQGHGVYLWGDNDPYHADADYLATALLGADMKGSFMGNTVVGLKSETSSSGLLRNHLITTGLEYVYEGITIAAINDPKKLLTPLIWSSDGNVVASIYEKDGKRLVLDGGFTRLYINWDTAGTGRYVKNAAAWLVNYEKFGKQVLGPALKNEKLKN